MFFRQLVLLAVGALCMSACGVIPVSLTIDEFAVEVDLDQTINGMNEQLLNQGILPPGSLGIPEKWPPSLPQIRFQTIMRSSPQIVDLTPDDPNSDEGQKYAEINEFLDAIVRIELNRMIIRFERNTTNIPFPQMRLEMAGNKNANPEDKLAWKTIGTFKGVPKGTVTDLELEYNVGGESYLSSQLSDAEKEFAIRVVGVLTYDSVEVDERPRGYIKIRPIIVTTFFVDTTKAAKAAL